MPLPGERIASLEEQGRTHQREIDSLRDTRHEHAERLQDAERRVDQTEKAVEVMSTQVVPSIRKTLEQQATEIADIGRRYQKTRLDFGWVMRILTFVLMALVAIGEGVLILKINDGFARPVVQAPAKTSP